MSPMKRIVKRPRSSTRSQPQPSEGERRSKRREERRPSSSPPSRTTAHGRGNPDPPPSSSSRRSTLIGTRAITTGRRIDFDFLDSLNSRLPFWIENQGWRSFCRLNELSYPSLMLQFYETLKPGKFHIEGMVKGIRILVNEEILSQVLDIPRSGVVDLTLLPEEKLITRQTILEKEDVNLVEKVSANQLSLEMRLLHHFVAHIFTPRTGRYDWISDKDIVLMRHIIEKRPINLPYVMLVQMREAERRYKANLPYGMVYTLLFKHYGVDLSGEVGKALLGSDTYTDRSLVRMGYILSDGVWKKKDSHLEEEAAGATETEAEPDTGVPEAPDTDFFGPPPPPPPNQIDPNMMATLFASLTTHIDAQFTEIKTQLKDLQNQISSYASTSSSKDQATDTHDLDSESEDF